MISATGYCSCRSCVENGKGAPTDELKSLAVASRVAELEGKLREAEVQVAIADATITVLSRMLEGVVVPALRHAGEKKQQLEAALSRSEELRESLGRDALLWRRLRVVLDSNALGAGDVRAYLSAWGIPTDG
jgi:hypothetical protein